MTRPFYNARRIKSVASWYDAALNPCDKEHGVYYFRSKLELMCAQRLQIEKQEGRILSWSTGKKMKAGHWDFNLNARKPYRANSQYTLDFEVNFSRLWEPKPSMPRIVESDYWVEVKGSPQGIIKIERALKHYPERRLMVYDKDGMQPAQAYLDKIRWRKRVKSCPKK